MIGSVPKLTEIVVLISYLFSIRRMILLLCELYENLVPYIVVFLFAFALFILSFVRKQNVFFKEGMKKLSYVMVLIFIRVNKFLPLVV